MADEPTTTTMTAAVAANASQKAIAATVNTNAARQSKRDRRIAKSRRNISAHLRQCRSL
jgi:hypothetical protein